MTNGYPSQGGFAINEAKCPECGAPLQIPANAEWLTCSFCGTNVHVTYPHQQPQQTGIEPDGTIRDRATGYGLFHVRPMPGWQVSGTALQRTGTSSRPYVPQVELRDRAGGVITMRLGDAGARRSAGMAAVLGMYGGQLAGVDTANYADVPDPLMIADMTAAGIAANMGASDFRFARQLACPDLEQRRQREFARIQRIAQGQGAMVSSPFIAVVLRTYELTCDGQPLKAACFVEMSAAKDGMGLGEGLGGVMEGIGGLGAGVMEGIGGLVGSGAVDFFMGGGLIGKMKRDRAAQAQQATQAQAQQPAQPAQAQAQQPAQVTQAQAQQALSQGVAWCAPEFADYVAGGTIYWYVQAIVTFTAPAAAFDEQFESTFLPLVGALDVHPDVESLSMQVVQQEAARIQGATQTQLAQNQAAFQAQQAAHRQQQAAFDSYNQSVSAARDARHQQFMASSHQQFDHRTPDYSEAIRGVNTYTTSDGREVELSVHADHAWENQAGDVIGTSGGFDPGANWTEIPRT